MIATESGLRTSMVQWHVPVTRSQPPIWRGLQLCVPSGSTVHNGVQKRLYAQQLASKFAHLIESDLRIPPDERVSISGRTSALVVVSQKSKEAALWPWRNRWRYMRSQRSGLPHVDWRRYNLQVLFVDR